MLSAAKISEYHQQGFIFPLRVLSKTQAADVLHRLDSITAEQIVALQNPWFYKSYLLFTWLDELVRAASVLDRVMAILGPDIICFSCDIWRKQAGETRHISWHQDASYWRFDPPEVLTAWISLTSSTRKNGCMRFAPGSHLLGAIRHVDTFAFDNMLSHGQVVDHAIDESASVYAQLQAGECSLHHCLLAHASSPNNTAKDRVGLCIRYAPGALRQIDGPPVSAMTVRGQATGNLIEEHPPTNDLSPGAIEQHNRLLGPHAPTRYTRF